MAQTPNQQVPSGELTSGGRSDQVRERLRAVVDPELGDTIVDLGMVRGVAVDGGHVTVEVALTIAACPLRTQIEKDVVGHVQSLDWVQSVRVEVAEMDAEERAAVMARARWKAREDAPETAVPANARVLAIASGKGGVGKSSVTVNLAVALAARGLTVGVLDADIWGFSVPRLLGMEGGVEARQGKMVPLERRVGPGTLRVLSMGFLADEEQAIMWRGLVLNRAVQQFLQDAHWGDLDYLLIDLPPGTGDIQMGLARLLPRTELLVVTTPPVAAQKVAARAADMARRGYLRVAGVIENMSDFTCEHGTTYALFGSGGGERLARGLGVPLVGSIPLHPEFAASGDAGLPVASQGDSELAAVFADIARVIAEEVAPLIEAQGCTARMLERVEAAVTQGDADSG
ncbi:MAG TPA: Mrp/NBP35 family ATP-binding protein [Acidimicrobiales bacterium]|jgi:ATP-binding protein involved in chromosome partitioning|nr:Mrp/NBP35 family ATP-binding protein [Acidimicrobiales bacterium]